MKKVILFLLIIAGLPSFSQPKDPMMLLNSLKKKYSAVKDYSVDATITVDVWFLNMPVKKARLYYKHPDKIHVESKGFALLPKRAAGFEPGAFIGDHFTAVFIRTEKWGSSSVDVIKTIPDDPNSDIILSTFWIDVNKLEIRKLEINTKTGGTFQVFLDYNRLPYDLPQEIRVVFDIKEMTMPKDFTGEMPKKDKTKGKKEEKQGKVTISYQNYQVNKGLSDKLFEEKK